MEKKQWFIHSDGETFGPIPTNAVRIMLQQKRVNSAEFIWCDGISCWKRILDYPEFQDCLGLPPYPDARLPLREENKAESQRSNPAETSMPSYSNVPVYQVEENKVERQAPVQKEHDLIARKSNPETASGIQPIAQAVSTGSSEQLLAPKMAKADVIPLRNFVEPLSHSTGPRESLPRPSKGEVHGKASVSEEKERTIRFAPRVPLGAKILIDVYGSLQVVDISETGMLFICETPIEPGTHLEFTLESSELSKVPLRMTGVIVRNVMINDTRHSAIEFTRVNPAYKRLLKEFISTRMMQEAG